MTETIRLAVFASGNGTNVENIAHYFKRHETIHVYEVFSNKADAYVHERAKKLAIPSNTFGKDAFVHYGFLEKLQKIDYIILAGFLWLIPQQIIKAFRNKIINIHPALLPKYGGKGMYGAHVHRAVIEGEEKESGITIHLVNEEYDKGQILFQAKCAIEEGETVDSLEAKIHQLEYEHFPKVIEEYILKTT